MHATVPMLLLSIAAATVQGLPSRAERIAGILAQKPLHTTALMAGAAVTSLPQPRITEPKQRPVAPPIDQMKPLTLEIPDY
jgi:hypothetical protein